MYSYNPRLILPKQRWRDVAFGVRNNFHIAKKCDSIFCCLSFDPSIRRTIATVGLQVALHHHPWILQYHLWGTGLKLKRNTCKWLNVVIYGCASLRPCWWRTPRWRGWSPAGRSQTRPAQWWRTLQKQWKMSQKFVKMLWNESVTRFFTPFFLDFNLFWQVIHMLKYYRIWVQFCRDICICKKTYKVSMTPRSQKWFM